MLTSNAGNKAISFDVLTNAASASLVQAVNLAGNTTDWSAKIDGSGNVQVKTSNAALNGINITLIGTSVAQ